MSATSEVVHWATLTLVILKERRYLELGFALLYYGLGMLFVTREPTCAAWR